MMQEGDILQNWNNQNKPQLMVQKADIYPKKAWCIWCYLKEAALRKSNDWFKQWSILYEQLSTKSFGLNLIKRKGIMFYQVNARQLKF